MRGICPTCRGAGWLEEHRRQWGCCKFHDDMAQREAPELCCEEVER